MSRAFAAASLASLLLALVLPPGAGHAQIASAAESQTADFSEARFAVRSVIQRHLGRPYVWGACGLKSFDCSGFVWRVMQENGILTKRTTARKYYMTLPKVSGEERWNLGNIVFFSNLKHCGIVESPQTFYHAAVTAGTHLSRFDPLWRARVSGVRAMPWPERRGTGPSAASSPSAP